jgi:hypothetical protein
MPSRPGRIDPCDRGARRRGAHAERSSRGLQRSALGGHVGRGTRIHVRVAVRGTRPDLVQAYERATAQMQELKDALVAGPYPGLTAGRPDLYKAFAWRFWQLLRSQGRAGVVLPRKALEASGMAKWRRAVLADGVFTDVTMLVNTGGWVFDDVHQQYTVGLVVAQNEAQTRITYTRGLIRASYFRERGLIGSRAGAVRACVSRRARRGVSIAPGPRSAFRVSAGSPQLSTRRGGVLLARQCSRTPRLATPAGRGLDRRHGRQSARALGVLIGGALNWRTRASAWVSSSGA